MQSDINVTAMYTPVEIPLPTVEVSQEMSSETLVQRAYEIPASIQNFKADPLMAVLPPSKGTTPATLLRQEGVPFLTVGGREVPLYGGSINNLVWPLSNLILAVSGIVLTLFLAFRLLLLNRHDPDREEDLHELGRTVKTGRRSQLRPVWVVLAILAGIVGVVLFRLTQSMDMLMVLVDNWTIVQALIFLTGAAGVVLAIGKRDHPEGETSGLSDLSQADRQE